MRSGDTDYLRFILRYLAIRRGGLPPVPASAARPLGGGGDGFPDVCSNMAVQTEGFKGWCAPNTTSRDLWHHHTSSIQFY